MMLLNRRISSISVTVANADSKNAISNRAARWLIYGPVPTTVTRQDFSCLSTCFGCSYAVNGAACSVRHGFRCLATISRNADLAADAGVAAISKTSFDELLEDNDMKIKKNL